MSAQTVGYPYDWDLGVDTEGHREYKLSWRVVTNDPMDGPDIALTAPGLPTPGASLAIGNTSDPWAFYQRKGRAKLVSKKASRKIWDVALTFTTKPARRCQNQQIEDPLLEPHKVSGSFQQYTAEAVKDKDGKALLNSANERFTGPVVQRDFHRPTINLEMNVSWIDLDFLAGYVDAVNDGTWWGQSARVIKCSSFDWERVLYGTCNYYFVVRFGFELKADTWDFKILDEGRKVKVAGSSPERFVQYKDERDENTTTLLDGNGNALDPGADPEFQEFRVYPEKDFSAVGWPASLF